MNVERIRIEPRGVIKQLYTMRDSEILVSGAAGTGKTFGICNLLHLRLNKYPNSRGLMVRKTRRSMTESCMRTYEKEVLKMEADGVKWRAQDQKYVYPNGSEFVVAGLDKASKALSTQYNFIYVNEATELKVEDWETLTTRIRHPQGMPFNQIIADCNPDSQTHHLYKRWKDNKLKMLFSKHEENPLFWDDVKKVWTERGKKYIFEILEGLTGVRYKRLRHGLWVGAEGAVYEEWDRTLHLVDAFVPPADWERVWAIDFGYKDPFVWQDWAIAPSGDMYLVREIYMTQRTVVDHAEQIIAVTGINENPRNKPLACVTDHDAEDRAQFERTTGVVTLPAYKKLSSGINAVKNRLSSKNRKPTLYIMRDSLVEVDQDLDHKRWPICTAQEFDCYVWDDEEKRNRGTVPVDKFNHGLDALRYAVSFVDDMAIDPHEEEHTVSLYEEVGEVVVSPY